MGINISPTSMALTIPNKPRVKSSSSTSFLTGDSSSRCHANVKTTYNIKIFTLSNPTNPERHKIRVVKSFVTKAPLLPNIVKEIRPPSVSVMFGKKANRRIKKKK